jgi:nucleoside 2-deoxyribosyltransferase
MDSINNLKDLKVYLVGAMDRVHDGGVTWRQELTSILQNLGIKVIDPCKKPIHGVVEDDETRQWIDYYKETKQYAKIREKFGIIRSADLRCVDISDFIIANIDLDVHACGTYEEIVTANRQKKPILILCKQGKSMAPNWLFFMLPHEHIFSNIEDMMDYLIHINTLEDISSLSRWFFFKGL